jgi:hypothetical protein
MFRTAPGSRRRSTTRCRRSSLWRSSSCRTRCRGTCSRCGRRRIRRGWRLRSVLLRRGGRKRTCGGKKRISIKGTEHLRSWAPNSFRCQMKPGRETYSGEDLPAAPDALQLIDRATTVNSATTAMIPTAYAVRHKEGSECKEQSAADNGGSNLINYYRMEGLGRGYKQRRSAPRPQQPAWVPAISELQTCCATQPRCKPVGRHPCIGVVAIWDLDRRASALRSIASCKVS